MNPITAKIGFFIVSSNRSKGNTALKKNKHTHVYLQLLSTEPTFWLITPMTNFPCYISDPDFYTLTSIHKPILKLVQYQLHYNSCWTTQYFYNFLNMVLHNIEIIPILASYNV